MVTRPYDRELVIAALRQAANRLHAQKALLCEMLGQAEEETT